MQEVWTAEGEQRIVAQTGTKTSIGEEQGTKFLETGTTLLLDAASTRSIPRSLLRNTSFGDDPRLVSLLVFSVFS